MYALHREYENPQKETENTATATETRAEWKREAVEKAAKVAEAPAFSSERLLLLKDSQPSAIASNLKLRK